MRQAIAVAGGSSPGGNLAGGVEAQARAAVAADIAAEQIADLARRGIEEFHIYTMNRAPLTIATLDRLGITAKAAKVSSAAA